MDLFTYLLGKNGKNAQKDLFSYLLGKNAGGSGTYTTFSGTSLNISNTLQAKIKNIALEGNTSQDGTPTPDTPIPIKVVTGEQNVKIQNKNLLPGKIFEHCTITNTGEKTIDNSRACSDFIKVISNDNYYLSYGVINGFTGIAFYDENYNYISRIIWSNEISHIITIPNNIEYVKIFLQKNSPLIATENQFADDKVQFVKSNVATDYVEHQGQTYPLSLGNIELARIGNYKDYIFKNVISSPYYNADLDLNGWYLHKEMVKLILTENSYWSSRNVTISGETRKVFFSRYDNLRSYSSMRNMKCNYFQVKNTDGTSPTADNQFYNNYERTNNLEFTKFDITTEAEWKEWLSTHNIVLIGKMVNPTNTKITDTTLIQQLENISNNARSYKETTIIECTSASTDNETIGFSGDIKVTSIGLGNSLNTSLLSSNIQEEPNINDIQEEPNLDDVNEIEETNDEPIQNEEIEEPIEEEVS